jgi:hypothetical protein
LIGFTCVFQPERHSFVSVCPEQGDERGFDLIFLLERNLVISRIAIKEAEEYTTRRRIDNLINARQPEVILRAMLVEIDVINAHSPFIILFPYKDGISYPLWMDYFFNEASREEFSYFPFNCLTLVVSKPSKALLFGHSLWVYIQTMLD